MLRPRAAGVVGDEDAGTRETESPARRRAGRGRGGLSGPVETPLQPSCVSPATLLPALGPEASPRGPGVHWVTHWLQSCTRVGTACGRLAQSPRGGCRPLSGLRPH